MSVTLTASGGPLVDFRWIELYFQFLESSNIVAKSSSFFMGIIPSTGVSVTFQGSDLTYSERVSPRPIGGTITGISESLTSGDPPDGFLIGFYTGFSIDAFQFRIALDTFAKTGGQ